MLGKLIKYEWKNIWKAGVLMLLGMFVVTVIGCVVLRMPGGLVTEIADGNNMNATQSWFVLSSFVATLILYVIMLLASTWGMRNTTQPITVTTSIPKSISVPALQIFFHSYFINFPNMRTPP